MSDQLREGHELASQGVNWLSAWSNRIQPHQVTITGGEPTLNPDLVMWCQLVRNTWPAAHIEIHSNGSELKRSKIIPALTQIGNCTLVLTCHHHPINIGYSLFESQMVVEIKQDGDWLHAEKTDTALVVMHKQSATIKILAQEVYTRPYHGTAQGMRPWKSKDAAASHSMCATPKHPVMYKNRLYKCLPIANLRDTLVMNKLDDNAAWWDYLQYTGYGPDDNLDEFFQDVGTPNIICTMCSSQPAKAQFKHYELGNVGQKVMIYPNWSRKTSTDATM
jgi:hypothetical protein